jgi:hypothetical protein
MNADAFYDALSLAQLASPREVAEAKPWGNVAEWTF